MAKYIFLATFVLGFLFQWNIWNSEYLLDLGMWSNQAFYVDTGNPDQFNAKWAYGHPGGPIILSMIFAHKVFDWPYSKDSMVFLMAILNSILIASISTFCFLFRRNSLWWVAVFGTLSIHRMFFNTTPPTGLVSFLLLFLCLITLYISENKEKIRIPILLLWSLLVGLSIATRADIGFIIATFCSFVIWRYVGWKPLFLLLVNAFFIFCMFDPFMWFMPVQHVRDLLAKIVYHYADFRVKHMWFLEVINISLLSLFGMLSFVFSFFYKKGKYLPIPAFFGWFLLATTSILYYIFMTANYQVSRYYTPLIFIWETLLSLFLFSMIEKSYDGVANRQSQFLTRRRAEITIIALLVGLQVGLSLDYLVFM